MIRAVTQLLAVLALAWSGPVLGEVRIHFHSFNGSVLFGRFPHTFVVLEGTLEETGAPVSENYGFSAKRPNASVLKGPVEHVLLTETPRNVARTNRHFSLTITDEQYHEITAEIRRWQNAPGRYYDLDTRNCIHFVGRMATMLGLRVEYPETMLRRPKKWLNHITTLNPGLRAQEAD
ncbi:MAG: hypothetical protein WA918_11040 [Erythrobacter sp.]